MGIQETKKEVIEEAAIVSASAPVVTPIAADLAGRKDEVGGGRVMRSNTRRGPSREGRPKPEYDQKIINIRRVTRVAAGGKRFNFSVALILGNKKGSVGVGLGKGADTALAIDKAVRSAKKHLITLRLTKTGSIPHVVETKYSSARVFIQPSPGRGIVAGSAIRSVLELAGIKDVTAKLFSPTKNKLNIARVAIKALSTLPRIK